MCNLTLSKALIDMQPLHTLLYVEFCIEIKHVLAAPAFDLQAAPACSLSASFSYHRSMYYITPAYLNPCK